MRKTLPLKPWNLPKMGWNFSLRNFGSHLYVDTFFIAIPFYTFVWLGELGPMFFGFVIITCRIWYEIGNGIGAIDYVPCEGKFPQQNYFDPSDLLPVLFTALMTTSMGSYLFDKFDIRYQFILFLMWISYIGSVSSILIILNLFMDGKRFFKKLEFLNKKS